MVLEIKLLQDTNYTTMRFLLSERDHTQPSQLNITKKASSALSFYYLKENLTPYPTFPAEDYKESQ